MYKNISEQEREKMSARRDYRMQGQAADEAKTSYRLGGKAADEAKSGYRLAGRADHGRADFFSDLMGGVRDVARIGASVAPIVGMYNPGLGAGLGIAGKVLGGSSAGFSDDRAELDMLYQGYSKNASPAESVMKFMSAVFNGKETFPPTVKSQNLSMYNISVYGSFGSQPTVPTAFIRSVQPPFDFHRYIFQSSQVLFDGTFNAGVYTNGLPSQPASTITGVRVTLSEFFVQAAPAQDIALNPPLVDQFHSGMVITSRIEYVSDATSTTTTAISGSLSMGYVSDVSSIMQLNPPQLIQQSQSQKDGRTGIPCQEGVVAIQGPEIPDELNNIHAVETAGTVGNLSALFKNVNGNTRLSSKVDGSAPNNSVTTPGNQATPTNSCWISYYSTAFWQFPSPLGSSSNNFQGPAISPFDAPMIRCHVNVPVLPAPQVLVPASPAALPAMPIGTLTFYHYFINASISAATGLVSVTVQDVQVDTKIIYPAPAVVLPSPALGTPNITATAPPPVQIVESIAIRPETAQYLGTFVQLNRYPQPLGLNQFVPFTATGTFAAQGAFASGGAVQLYPSVSADVDFSVSVIDSIPLKYFSSDQEGGYQVVRADNLAGGQNLRVTGEMWLALLADSQVQPFTRTKPNELLGQLMPLKTDALPFLRYLFDEPKCPIRRMWAKEEYDQFINMWNGFKEDASAALRFLSPTIEAHASGFFSKMVQGGKDLGSSVLSSTESIARAVLPQLLPAVRDMVLNEIGLQRTPRASAASYLGPSSLAAPVNPNLLSAEEQERYRRRPRLM